MLRKLFILLTLLAHGTLGFSNVNPFQMGFVKNEGLIFYPNGNQASDILYRLSTPHFLVELRPNGFSYTLSKLVESDSKIDNNLMRKESFERIDVVLEGSASSVKRVESNEMSSLLQKWDGKKGNKMQTIKHFKRIVYKGIYKGIDLEFLVDAQGNFKYNFLLHRGANACDIVLKIIGAKETKVNAKGNLEILGNIGSIEEDIPLSYETNTNGVIGKTFLATYVPLGLNQFGFKISGTQNKLMRVIDPVPFCSYLGGTGSEYPESIIEDDSGNFYFMGRTNSSSAIATPGSYQPNIVVGNYDVFICKFNKDGAIIWGTYYGGNSIERGTEIDIDREGNIIVCGYTQSSSGVATSGAFQTTMGGTQDAFISKFNPGGGIIWATYYGFSGEEVLYSFVTDNSGDYYFVGNSNSTVFYNQPGVHQKANAGLEDAILLKFSASGSYIWGTYLGGSEQDLATSVAVDKHKNIYVAGSTYSSSGFGTLGAYKPTITALNDPFIVKFDSNGTQKFGTYLGGNNTDYLLDMLLDHQGNLVFIGQTSSDTLLTTSNAYQVSFGKGTFDGFLGKMDTAGNPIFLTYIGGANVDLLTGVCIDKDNEIYIVGHSSTQNGLSTIGAFQSTYAGGGYDALFAKYSSNGSKLWLSYWGGPLYENGNCITYSREHALILGGLTTSTSNIATVGSHQNTLGGAQDAMFLKFYLPKDTCANPFKAGFTLNKLIQCDRDNQFVFTDTTNSSTNAKRIWDFGNGTFGSGQIETVQYLPAVENKFTVRLTLTDGNCIDSAKRDVFLIRSPNNKTISGNILPRPGITETYDVPSTNGSTFKWVFESGIAVGTTFTNSIKIKWTAEDTVTLKVVETTGGGCLGDTAYLQVVIHDPTGTEEHNLKNLLTVYPNPSNGLVYVNYSGVGQLSLELRDMQGRLVFAGNQDNNTPISMGEFTAGIYFLMIKDEQGNTLVQRIELIH